MDTSSGSSSSDRRRHPRHDLIAQVHVKRAAADYVLELRNISRSGVLLLLGTLPKPPWLDIDRRIELSIVNPETLDAVDLGGTVVRIQRDELGLSLAVDFGELPPATRAAIDQLVQLGRPQPPPLPATTGQPQPPPLPL
jgi:hypothetical protein